MNRIRYLAKSTGDNMEGTTAGFVKLMELMAHYDDAVIVVPQLKGVEGTLLGMLLDQLSPGLAKRLSKERRILLEGNKQIQLCSQNTLKDFRRAQVYLVLWGSKFAIEDIENLPSWHAVVLVSWAADDYAKWIASHPVSVIFDDKSH